jgi:hypothetical protein
MHCPTSPFLLGVALCAAVGCEPDPDYPEYPLDGIKVFVGFDEPICGGTFDWMEARLRWLESVTGLPIAQPPIEYYWLREDVKDYCDFGACGITLGDRMYSPLELFDHELVHGHMAQLGVPRPWLAEGMARMFEDTRWTLPPYILTPMAMLEESNAFNLDYNSAASFVRFLRDRFGMPALLELYAALDRVDVEGTSDVFLAVLGEDWDAVESAYLPAYTPNFVGAINCDFPVLAPAGDTWTLPVASPCEDAATVGPYLGWVASDTPASERYVILEIPAAGTYTVTMTSSAGTSVNIIDCGDAPEYFSRHDTRLNETIELSPGRKRLKITTDIADEAVGEVVLSGPLTPDP